LPSGLNCPDYRSVLYEMNDKGVLRFRCRCGHAYSAQSLLSAQSGARKMHFSSIFGALIEEATLAKPMHAAPSYDSDSRLVDGLGSRIEFLQREATQVSEWLYLMTGLVEPEPDSQD
jgi:two-component system chemotaxis response regulator CheB